MSLSYLFVMSGPAGYLVALASVVGLVLLGLGLRKVWRGRRVATGWWLVGPSLMLSAGVGGTRLALAHVREVFPSLDPEWAVAAASSGLTVVLAPSMLALLAAVILLDLSALALGLILAARAGRPIRLHRLAATCFVAMSALIVLAAWDGYRGWTLLGLCRQTGDWFLWLCVVAGAGSVACWLAVLRRAAARQHVAVTLMAVFAGLLMLAVLPLAGEMTGSRAIGGAPVASRSALLTAGALRYTLLEHGWKMALAAAALPALSGLAALPWMTWGPPRLRIGPALLLGVAILLPVSLGLAGPRSGWSTPRPARRSSRRRGRGSSRTGRFPRGACSRRWHPVPTSCS